jgi:tRNA pseudouridine13 synthase
VAQASSPTTPLVSADLPGTGGKLRQRDEDFVVEELPAYAPAGAGEHVFVTIEKRDLTTSEAVKRIARALAVNPHDIGYAGLKDRHAITRQQLSLPRPVTPEQALALELPGLRVLSAARHGNKLKTGHLHGNRFVLTLRDLAAPVGEAAERARAIFARLAQPPGVPNFYGEQRFGARGDNAARGLALLRGKPVSPPPRDGREARFLLSSLQSDLFNAYLAERLRDGLYALVIAGDILAKVKTGAVFASEDPAAEQARVEAGEIAPTGPMFGSRMRAPAPGSEADARELAVLTAAGVNREEFSRHRLTEGTRRALGVPLGEPTVEVLESEAALRLGFGLPAGAYATVVAAEVMKNLPADGTDAGALLI